jgi:hypothetical protein
MNKGLVFCVQLTRSCYCYHDHRCVGGLGLAVVCRLLAEDYSGWRGGAPDLLLWRPIQGEACVSEVKVG